MPESETAGTVIGPGNLIDAKGGPPQTGQAVFRSGAEVPGPSPGFDPKSSDGDT